MAKSKIFNNQAAVLEDESYSNSIIPTTESEMWRRVELHGNTEVLGGIFADNILVGKGRVYVRDAVYARDFIRMTNEEESRAWFHSVVSAGNSIDTKKNNGRVRFSSDIHSKVVNLSNTAVYGNIICREAVIENSIIFGGVYAEGSLDVGNSILGTFETDNLYQRGPIGLIQPFALSKSISKDESRIYVLLSFDMDNPDGSNNYEIQEKDIRDCLIQGKDGTESVYKLLSASGRIFDLRAFVDSAVANIKKIEGIVSMEGDDYRQLEEQLAAFEDPFFRSIESGLDLSPRIAFSDFMRLADEVVQDFYDAEPAEIPGELPQDDDSSVEGEDVSEPMQLTEDTLGDPMLRIVQEAARQIGDPSLVKVKEGLRTETRIEVLPGYRTKGHFVSPLFVTDTTRSTAEFSDTYVIVCKDVLTSPAETLPLFEQIAASGLPALFIAKDFGEEMLKTLAVNKMSGSLKAVAACIDCPAEELNDVLTDIHTVAGGRLFETGQELGRAKLSELRTVKSAEISGEFIDFVLHEGVKDRLKDYIDNLERALNEGDRTDSEPLNERIRSFKTEFAVVNVGDTSEPEIKDNYAKAVSALTSFKGDSQSRVEGGS